MKRARTDPSLDELLADVVAFHANNKRALFGLSEDEIGALERRIGRRLPRCLRAIVTSVGLLTNPFGMEALGRDVDGQRRWLQDVPRSSTIDPDQLVAFSNDGSDNLLLLRCSDDDGTDVLRFDHDLGLVTSTEETLLAYVMRAWSTRRARLLLGKPPRTYSVELTLTAESRELLTEAIDKLSVALGATLERGEDGSPKWVGKSLGAPAGVVFVLPLAGPRQLAMRWNGDDYAWKESSHECGASLTLSDSEQALLEAHRMGSDTNVRTLRFRRCAAELGLRFHEVDYGLV